MKYGRLVEHVARFGVDLAASLGLTNGQLLYLSRCLLDDMRTHGALSRPMLVYHPANPNCPEEFRVYAEWERRLKKPQGYPCAADGQALGISTPLRSPRASASRTHGGEAIADDHLGFIGCSSTSSAGWPAARATSRRLTCFASSPSCEKERSSARASCSDFKRRASSSRSTGTPSSLSSSRQQIADGAPSAMCGCRGPRLGRPAARAMVSWRRGRMRTCKPTGTFSESSPRASSRSTRGAHSAGARRRAD